MQKLLVVLLQEVIVILKMATEEQPLKPGFHRIELNKTVWEVPEKYINLSPVGAGAYGQVWYVSMFYRYARFIKLSITTQ